MSSYLAEVLSSAEKVEVENISTKCNELASDVEVCKTGVLSYVENVYVRFIQRPKENKVLANKIKQLQEEISGILNKAEQLTQRDLTKSENDLQQHFISLKKMDICISFIAKLNDIYEALIPISDHKENKSYLSSMKKILDTEQRIKNLEFSEDLPVIQEFTTTIATERNSLLHQISNVIKDNIIFDSIENRSFFKINIKDTNIPEAFLALYFLNPSVTPLDNVTRFLWNNIFMNVVDNLVSLKIEVENDFANLEITTIQFNKKSSYIEVFANIKNILSFLLKYFNIPLSQEDSELTTLSYIGRDIRDNLSELLIKHCLQDTIPSTDEGLKQYEIVIKATEELETSLIAAKIFAEDTTSILEYANNIDVLFINKKCQEYVITAQELMKKDLHDLIEVGQSETPSLEKMQEFPRCCISKNVVDLLKLLEKIICKATSCSELCAGRLFCTVQNIARNYATFVPEYHKKLLQTIPQQIALFYNNCMYISHKLSEWNDTYLQKLPSLLKIGSSSFSDDGCQLLHIASEKFTAYVDSQIKQIEEIMKNSGLQRQTLEQLEPSTEKCIRQCLRQQELLKTVWIKVLPYKIYNETLGLILNSLCAYLIDTIVKFEDISSDAAEQLVELFKMIQTRGPKLFTDPKEVTLFVANWYKLNELGFVLNASLLDINDRWADGKGPLGLQFKAEELRQLIRALFQNTERRAALLAKIYV